MSGHLPTVTSLCFWMASFTRVLLVVYIPVTAETWPHPLLDVIKRLLTVVTANFRYPFIPINIATSGSPALSVSVPKTS
jgi:hypothetical protein